MNPKRMLQSGCYRTSSPVVALFTWDPSEEARWRIRWIKPILFTVDLCYHEVVIMPFEKNGKQANRIPAKLYPETHLSLVAPELGGEGLPSHQIRFGNDILMLKRQRVKIVHLAVLISSTFNCDFCVKWSVLFQWPFYSARKNILEKLTYSCKFAYKSKSWNTT